MEGGGHEGKTLGRYGFHHISILDFAPLTVDARLGFNLCSLALCCQHPALRLTPHRHSGVFVGAANKRTSEGGIWGTTRILV